MITLCIAVASGSAIGLSSRMTPVYEANAKVFVGPRSVDKGDATGAIQEITFSREFVASYAEILKSRPLAEKVVEKTRSAESGAELAERITTRIIPETRLIEVTVEDTSPERAQSYANETVNIFVADPDGQFGGSSGRSASVFEPALKPTTPIKPKPIENGLIAGLVGGMLGMGLALVLQRLDTAVRTRQDVERALAPLPVIGQIPLTEGRTSGVFIQDDPDSPQAEAMRILRTNVQFFSVDRPVRTALVTSPFAGEGKTTVSVNLAASMAAIGSTALLIETDLRKPVLHEVLDVDPKWGLSNVLAGQIELDEAVQRTRIPNLYVLTAGTIPPNPSELLGSQRMVDVIRAAEAKADTVILDTSPALPVTDAAVLAPHTDGVILVLRAGRTAIDKAREAVDNFLRHEVRMLGVIINGIERESGDSYYYSYRYYRRARKRNEKEWGTSDFEQKEREFLFAPRQPSARPAHGPSDTGEQAMHSGNGGAENHNPQAQSPASHEQHGGTPTAQAAHPDATLAVQAQPGAAAGVQTRSDPQVHIRPGIIRVDEAGNMIGSEAPPASAAPPRGSNGTVTSVPPAVQADSNSKAPAPRTTATNRLPATPISLPPSEAPSGPPSVSATPTAPPSWPPSSSSGPPASPSQVDRARRKATPRPAPEPEPVVASSEESHPPAEMPEASPRPPGEKYWQKPPPEPKAPRARKVRK